MRWKGSCKGRILFIFIKVKPVSQKPMPVGTIGMPGMRNVLVDAIWTVGLRMSSKAQINQTSF